MGRSYSHSARSNMPSPLRYATGTDTRAAYGYGRAPPASHHGHGSQPEARPQRVRRASYKTPDTRKWLFASLDYVTFAQCCMLTRNCARSAIRAAHAFGLLRDAAELAIELEFFALPGHAWVAPADPQLRGRPLPRLAPPSPLESHLAPLGHRRQLLVL